MTNLDRIVQNIQQELDIRGWDHKYLALEAGVSEGTVSRLFHPPHSVTLYSLCLVCDALDLKICCLPREENKV